MPKGCEETSFQPSGNVRSALPSGNRFVHSRYHGTYCLGRHQQHCRECIGALFQRRRRPRAAGDGEALSDVPVKLEMAELVGERETKLPRIAVEVIVAVPDDSTSMAGSGDRHPPNGPVGQIRISDINPGAFKNRLHIDTFEVHAAVEVVLQFFRKCVSLLRGRFVGVTYRCGTTSSRSCARRAPHNYPVPADRAGHGRRIRPSSRCRRGRLRKIGPKG